MSLLTPILESSPSDFLNLTQVSIDWRQWFESDDPLANETLLAEFGILCQRVPVEDIRALNLRLQLEVRKVCARAVQSNLSRASCLVPDLVSRWSTALVVSKPIQSISSPQNEWSEAVTLLCGLYLATKLVKTMIQSRHQGFRRLEQAQATTTASLLRATSNLQMRFTYGLSQVLMRVGWRRPEINPEIPSKVDIPRKASPSQIMSPTRPPQLEAKRKLAISDEQGGEEASCCHKAKRCKIDDQKETGPPQLEAKRKLAISDEQNGEEASCCHKPKRCKTDDQKEGRKRSCIDCPM